MMQIVVVRLGQQDDVEVDRVYILQNTLAG